MARRADTENQIGRRLRLKDLHLFSTVAECGSMAKAASRLGISQPAVSEVIATLEHAVGARLFDRRSQGVEPTMYGQALLKRSYAAFDELRQGIHDIEFLSDPTRGELKIACGTTLSATILPPVIETFFAAYPRVVIHAHELPPPTRDLSGLRDRKYDLVLGHLIKPLALEPLGNDVNVEPLLEDRLVIVAGAESRWTGRRRVGLADLADEPWIMGDSKAWQHQRLIEAFHSAGLPLPKPSIVSTSVHVRTNLLAKGRFILAISKLIADRYSLRVLPIELPIPSSPIVAFTMKNRTLSPLVERFVAHVRDIVKSLVLSEKRKRKEKIVVAVRNPRLSASL